MVNEFSISVRGVNNKAKYLFGGLLGSAIIFIAVYMRIPMLQGVVGMVAMGFIVAAIYVYNKHVAAEYTYSITVDVSDRPVFVVEQRVGKRLSTVCRIDLYGIRSVTSLDKRARKARRTEKGVLKFSYCPTMSPDSLYVIESRTSNENADVYIEGSAEFAKALVEAAQAARGDYASE